MSDRYAGKPFLKLVDAYVIDAIGHLDANTEMAAKAMEPTFRDKLATDGDWRAMVEEQMRFPDGMPGAIREVWDKGRIKFLAQTGREPDPLEFAMHFVDTKFPH